MYPAGWIRLNFDNALLMNFASSAYAYTYACVLLATLPYGTAAYNHQLWFPSLPLSPRDLSLAGKVFTNQVT